MLNITLSYSEFFENDGLSLFGGFDIIKSNLRFLGARIMKLLEPWEVFRLVYENRNLSKTARMLHVSQPALSQYIKTLEDAYQAPLFTRTNRGVAPTVAGDQLYEYVKHIAETISQSQIAVNRAMQGDYGELHLGASLTIADYVLPPVIASFSKAFPQVKIHLQVHNTEEIGRLLVEGKLALGFVEAPLYDMRISQMPFLQDQLGVIVAKEHWLAKKDSATLRDIAQERLLIREHGSGTRAVLEEALRKVDVRLDDFKTIMESSSPKSITTMVAHHAGISILSEWVVKEEVKRGELVFLPMKELDLTRNFQMITMGDLAEDAFAQKFVQHLSEIANHS